MCSTVPGSRYRRLGGRACDPQLTPLEDMAFKHLKEFYDDMLSLDHARYFPSKLIIERNPGENSKKVMLDLRSIIMCCYGAVVQANTQSTPKLQTN